MTKIEFQSSVGGLVDKANGVIEGVSVITEGVVQGHGMIADTNTLMDVKACMDAFGESGVKVKVNHYSGFDSIVGSLRNARIVGKQLKADLTLIKSHPMFDTIIELAENQPGTFGMSISFSGKTEDINGLPHARCTELYSVDLVDQPAANPGGLFSVDSKNQQGEDNMEIADVKRVVLDALGIKKKTEELDEEVTSFKTENERLTTDLNAANEKITSFESRITALESDIESRKKAEADLKTELSKALEDVKDFDAKVKTAAAAKALEITQGIGHPPVNQDPTEPGNDNDELSKLKGLAKVEAVFKKQFSK